MHILALLGRFIEDHSILSDVLLKVIEPKLPEGLPGFGGPLPSNQRSCTRHYIEFPSFQKDSPGFGWPRPEQQVKLHSALQSSSQDCALGLGGPSCTHAGIKPNSIMAKRRKGQKAKRWRFSQTRRCAPSSVPNTANSFRAQAMEQLLPMLCEGEFAEDMMTPHQCVAPRHHTAAWGQRGHHLLTSSWARLLLQHEQYRPSSSLI